MNFLDYLCCFFWFALAAGLIILVTSHRSSRSVVAIAHENPAAPKAPTPKDSPQVLLDPESRFVIRMDETEVSCHRPDGTIESVRWDDLQKVEVLTTSDGPLLPDVFWLLHGTEKGCCIPQGAVGHAKLLERLQKLPGFNNQVFIESMGSTNDALFVCWLRVPNEGGTAKAE